MWNISEYIHLSVYKLVKGMVYVASKKRIKYCSVTVPKRSTNFLINAHCIHMNISFSPFANKVVCRKFPIESRDGHIFRFRLLRHSKSGNQIVRMFLVQFFKMRHFPFLSPLAETQHVFQWKFTQEELRKVVRQDKFSCLNVIYNLSLIILNFFTLNSYSRHNKNN